MSGTASVILAIVLVGVLALTAAIDFMRHPRALETTSRLRIPAGAVPVLGAIKAAAAVGIVVGLSRPRLAEITGACLAFYFAVAVLTHFRAKDRLTNAIPAFVLFLVSLAYEAAQFAR